jgi:L-ribulose-5-phosphate 4-epimerase
MNDAWRNAAREYVAVAQRLWQRGLIAGSGGNLSLRLPGTSQIMIKPSGVANFDCQSDDLLAVHLHTGDVIGDRLPTKDLGFHLGIYRARPDVGGIVHAHGPWSTALTLLGYDELPLHTPHALANLCRVAVLPYAPSTSKALDMAVADAFRSRETTAVLLERHGLVAVGATLGAAANLGELVEETAQIAVLVRLGGG